MADRALDLDLREPENREFLQIYALIVNRILLTVRELQQIAGRPTTPASSRLSWRLKERIGEDARRLYGAYRIWQTKAQRLTAPQVGAALRALADTLSSLFLGPDPSS